VGLGLMGFQDALYRLRTPYASQEAVEFADRSMEAVCYYAYWASSELAAGAGPLLDLPRLAVGPRHPAAGHPESAGAGARWPCRRGPLDEPGLGGSAHAHPSARHAQQQLRGHRAHGDHLQHHRRRRLASSPPTEYLVKSNLSGEFTVVNEYLVRDLKQLGLWDEVMVMDLKHFDGSLRRIDRVPEELKKLYATAFEVEPVWLIEAGARRQKWIDQAQSLNIYMAGASGKKLDETYKLAWTRGLKTTYYLRTIGATHAEKSTVAKAGQLNAVAAHAAPAMAAEPPLPATDAQFCSIDNPDCEACQ
jgi:ribonucleoside-diphosphate reductase alpha chain